MDVSHVNKDVLRPDSTLVQAFMILIVYSENAREPQETLTVLEMISRNMDAANAMEQSLNDPIRATCAHWLKPAASAKYTQ